MRWRKGFGILRWERESDCKRHISGCSGSFFLLDGCTDIAWRMEHVERGFGDSDRHVAWRETMATTARLQEREGFCWPKIDQRMRILGGATRSMRQHV